jgi:hypothetical protein
MGDMPNIFEVYRDVLGNNYYSDYSNDLYYKIEEYLMYEPTEEDIIQEARDKYNEGNPLKFIFE